MFFLPTFEVRRRMTPRILKVTQTVDGSAATIVFKDRMDTTQSRCVLRVSRTAQGVREYTNFSWVDEHTLHSATPEVITTYAGQPVAVYMRGNIRSKRRFRLRNRTRCDRVEDEGAGAPVLMTAAHYVSGGSEGDPLTFDVVFNQPMVQDPAMEGGNFVAIYASQAYVYDSKHLPVVAWQNSTTVRITLSVGPPEPETDHVLFNTGIQGPPFPTAIAGGTLSDSTVDIT